MEFAIQVHPHDVRDEGAAKVVENIVERSRIKTIMPETGTLEERHPYPRGKLPHNPRREVVITEATLEIPMPAERFKGLPIRPRLSPEARRGEDYVGELTEAAAAAGAEMIPWLKAVNGAFLGNTEFICVYTVEDEPVPTWLCPNQPDTEEYVWRLISGILERYPTRAVLLDRIRYPDWSGASVSVKRMFTCFCPVCRSKMSKLGIDLVLLEKVLKKIIIDPMVLLEFDTRALTPDEKRVIEHWYKFRCESITRLTERLSRRLKMWNQENNRSVTFWLNLWPPSFAGLLGQDYPALARVCAGTKHFPYHRLGGGAALAALVRAFAPDGDDSTHQRLFASILRFLRLPYQVDFQGFEEQGFPVDFVRRETAIAKDAFGADKSVFDGIQIWDTPLSEIGAASRAAIEANADGLFFYCYGWAPLEALDAVGRIVEKYQTGNSTS